MIKTRRYYTDAEFVMLFQNVALVVYHGTRDVLERLDNVQKQIL